MRSIIFRFWDIEGKEMVSWESINKKHLHDYLSLEEGIVKPLQFTGLKDKNGNDIYEGDILINSIGQKMKVVWYKNGFYMEKKQQYSNRILYNPLSANYLENKVIIGNVFQNPKIIDTEN